MSGCLNFIHYKLMHENGVLLSLLCVNGQKRSSLIMILVADFSHVKILKKANNQKKNMRRRNALDVSKAEIWVLLKE